MAESRYHWVTRVDAVRAELLFCGHVNVAEIRVMADGIHWAISDLPELRLTPDAGIWGAHLDRPFWSEEGFDKVRTMINGRVREAAIR